MIILGDEKIPFETVSRVSKKEDIAQTRANSTLLFGFDLELLKFCLDNSLQSLVEINSIKEAIYANSLRAKYVVCKDLKLAKKVQKIAENYMFDTKVLVTIKSNKEFEKVAKCEIDGVIYKNIV